MLVLVPVPVPVLVQVPVPVPVPAAATPELSFPHLLPHLSLHLRRICNRPVPENTHKV